MVEETIWYWEYILKVSDEDEDKEVLRSGIVAATSFTEAMGRIEDFYGDDIIEVEKLKIITDIVFDFDLAKSDSSFDFAITEK